MSTKTNHFPLVRLDCGGAMRIIVTKELLEKSVARRRKLVSGPRPVLVVIGGAFSATPAAHRFAASGNYGEHTSALALVGDYVVCKERRLPRNVNCAKAMLEN